MTPSASQYIIYDRARAEFLQKKNKKWSFRPVFFLNQIYIFWKTAVENPLTKIVFASLYF